MNPLAQQRIIIGISAGNEGDTGHNGFPKQRFRYQLSWIKTFQRYYNLFIYQQQPNASVLKYGREIPIRGF